MRIENTFVMPSAYHPVWFVLNDEDGPTKIVSGPHASEREAGDAFNALFAVETADVLPQTQTDYFESNSISSLVAADSHTWILDCLACGTFEYTGVKPKHCPKCDADGIDIVEA